MAAQGVDWESKVGRSEASWAHGTLSSSISGVGAGGSGAPPPALSRLVKRTLTMDQPSFQRLKAWEGEPLRRRCCSGTACCLPVLHPSSRIYAWWALVMVLLDLSYTAIVCPFSVAFAPRGVIVSWAFALDFVAGLLFLGDLMVNFSVGYIVRHGMQERVVMSRRAIARLYVLRGTFAVDMLSTVAWFAQVAVLIVAWSGLDPTANADLASAIRIARVMRILRVLRLLKQLYLSHMSGARRLLVLKPHTLHVLQLFYVSFIIVNFCGCLWFFVAREADYEGSWVTHYAAFVARYSPDGSSVLTAAEVEGIPNAAKYLASIYWASTTILTVGYGDIIPWTPLETAVCMLVQLLGICFFGALLSSIANLIQRASKEARRGAVLEEKLHSIERYLREQRVARDVRRSIKRYYTDVWVQQQDGLDVAAFYAELPHALRTDMACSIASSALSQLHCFRAAQDSAAVLRAISSRLEPLQLPPGFTLCEEGEEATACWVLQEGQVWLNSQGELGSCEEEVLEGPALVGEAALLGAKLGHPCHSHTLRTHTRCKLWRLTSAGFFAALRSRPQAVEAIQAHLLHGTPPGGSCSQPPVLKSQSSAEAGSLQVFVDARSRTSSCASEAVLAPHSAAGGGHAMAAPGGNGSQEFLVGEGSTDADMADLGGRKITL